MQLDPIKPKLKPPGTRRLTLKCDILLSNYTFKSNLRCYNKGVELIEVPSSDGEPAAGACTRSLLSST